MRKLLSLRLMLGLTVTTSANGSNSHSSSSGGGSRGAYRGSVNSGGGSSATRLDALCPMRIPGPSNGCPRPRRRVLCATLPEPWYPAPPVTIPNRIVPVRIVTVRVNNAFLVGTPFLLGFNPFFNNSFFSPFGFGNCGGFGYGFGYGYGYPYNSGYYNPYSPYGQFPSDYVDTYGTTYSTMYFGASHNQSGDPGRRSAYRHRAADADQCERAVPGGHQRTDRAAQQQRDRAADVTGHQPHVRHHQQTYVSQILVPGDWVKVSFDPRDGYTPAAQSIVTSTRYAQAILRKTAQTRHVHRSRAAPSSQRPSLARVRPDVLHAGPHQGQAKYRGPRSASLTPIGPRPPSRNQ